MFKIWVVCGKSCSQKVRNSNYDIAISFRSLGKHPYAI